MQRMPAIAHPVYAERIYAKMERLGPLPFVAKDDTRYSKLRYQPPTCLSGSFDRFIGPVQNTQRLENPNTGFLRMRIISLIELVNFTLSRRDLRVRNSNSSATRSDAENSYGPCDSSIERNGILLLVCDSSLCGVKNIKGTVLAMSPPV